MTVVCLPNCGFLSETSRMIAVHRALLERGTPSVVATHGGPYEWALKAHGVPYHLIPPPVSGELNSVYLGSVNPLRQPRSVVPELEQEVRREVEFLKETSATAAVIGFTHTAQLAARIVGIPVMTTHSGSFVPPILSAGRLDCAQAFDRGLAALIPDALVERMMARLLPRTRIGTQLLNAVAERVGAPPLTSFFQLMLGDLALVTDVPEILGIPQAALEQWRGDGRFINAGTRLRYAGAIYAQLPFDVDQPTRHFLDTDKPKIYVALSSGARDNLQVLYDLLAGMDVRVVMAATGHDRALGTAPNIRVVDFLPAHRVMPLCDLVISHGGQGTVQTAIAAATPIIGFPLQPEQNFNLKQVERHGGGRCLSLRQMRRKAMRSSIVTMLTDASYRHSMLRLQALQATRDGPRLAAQHISEAIAPARHSGAELGP